jgi:hypothetical protein
LGDEAVAITTTTVGSGLSRAGAYFPFATGPDYWAMCCWVKVPSLPTGANKYCIWFRGDSAKVNPYIALYWSTSGLYLEVFDGATTSTTPVASQQTVYADQWYFVGAFYNGTVLTFTFNVRQRFNLTINLATFVFVQTTEYLGTDNTTSLGGLSLAYARTFNSWTASIFVAGSPGVPGQAVEAGLATVWSTDAAICLSDTSLANNTTGLNDTSGAGRNWTAAGTVNTLAAGPLDLIGGLWQSNFNTAPGYGDWTYVPNTFGTANVGCASSPAFGCNGNGQIYRQFNVNYTDGALRFFIWPYWSAASGEIQVAAFQRYTGTVVANFQVVMYLEDDGRIRIRLATSLAGTQDFYSAIGTIAFDGTGYAIQILANISGGNQRVHVYVNNAEVIDTGNVSTASLTNANWNQASLFVPAFANTKWVYDNVEVDNVGAYEDWPICTNTQIVNCVATAPPAPSDTVNERIRRLRRFPLPFNVSHFAIVSRLEWIIQSGMGLNAAGNPQGSDPVMQVRFSPDGGVTWGNWLQLSAGRQGQYQLRPALNQVGQFRNGLCEVVVSDPIYWYLLDCLADITWSE